jgi:hypothetical protein
MPRDWLAWHADYDTDSPLSRRLAIVRDQVRQAVLARGDATIQILSLCSGEGRDLIEPLADIGAAARVRGRLVELDPTLAERARQAIAEAGLNGLEVQQGDAGTTAAYAGAVPADLVLVCGVFGNISDGAIERTVRALPSLCASGATVIWTRHRGPPDRTPTIRRWFRSAGFRHHAFIGVPDSPGSVGVEQFVGSPEPFVSGVRLFEFEAT